jgi:hypothetical protein
MAARSAELAGWLAGLGADGDWQGQGEQKEEEKEVAGEDGQGRMARGRGGEDGCWISSWLDSEQMEIGRGRESRKRRRRRSQGRMARGGWPGGEGGRMAAGSAELAGSLAGLGRWRVPAFFIHG